MGLDALWAAVNSTAAASSPASSTGAAASAPSPALSTDEQSAVYAATAPSLLAMPPGALLVAREASSANYAHRIAAARVRLEAAGAPVEAYETAGSWTSAVLPDAARPRFTSRLRAIGTGVAEVQLAAASGVLLVLADMINHAAVPLPSASTGSSGIVPPGPSHGWLAAAGIAVSLYSALGQASLGDMMTDQVTTKVVRTLDAESDHPRWGLRQMSMYEDEHFGHGAVRVTSSSLPPALPRLTPSSGGASSPAAGSHVSPVSSRLSRSTSTGATDSSSGIWSGSRMTVKQLEQHLHDIWLRAALTVSKLETPAPGASSRELFVDSEWVLRQRRAPRTGLLIAFGVEPQETM